MSHQFESAQQDDGRWITKCLDHPGMWGGGATQQEALEECRQTIDGWHATFGETCAPLVDDPSDHEHAFCCPICKTCIECSAPMPYPPATPPAPPAGGGE